MQSPNLQRHGAEKSTGFAGGSPISTGGVRRGILVQRQPEMALFWPTRDELEIWFGSSTP